MRGTVVFALMGLVGCADPLPAGPVGPDGPAPAPPDVVRRIPDTGPDIAQLLDPAGIRIRTRVARHEDCTGMEADYLRARAPAPNRLVLRWLVQNMGEPFGTRVTLRRRSVRLRIEHVHAPLGGLICGPQAYHMRTSITGLPAGTYRVVGPQRARYKMGDKIFAPPPRRRTITVAGVAPDPARPWPRRGERRRFEP